MRKLCAQRKTVPQLTLLCIVLFYLRTAAEGPQGRPSFSSFSYTSYAWYVAYTYALRFHLLSAFSAEGSRPASSASLFFVVGTSLTGPGAATVEMGLACKLSLLSSRDAFVVAFRDEVALGLHLLSAFSAEGSRPGSSGFLFFVVGTTLTGPGAGAVEMGLACKLSLLSSRDAFVVASGDEVALGLHLLLKDLVQLLQPFSSSWSGRP